MGRIIDDETAQLLGGIGKILGITALAYAETIIKPNDNEKIVKKWNSKVDEIICKSSNTCNRVVNNTDHIGLVDLSTNNSRYRRPCIEDLPKDIQEKILAEPSKLKREVMIKSALRANRNKSK